MADFDLRSYCERFDEVSRARFGKSYDLRALQSKFAYLRQPVNWLSVGHVMKLFECEATPYTRYWPRPDARAIDRELKSERVRLAPFAPPGREMIHRLLCVLHNLGAVSLILRLTYPECFAVFSVPVASLLQVQRPGATELYLEFCAELAEWQKRFRIPTVAETEMGLWAFHHLSVTHNGAGEGAGKAFDADIWIQRRRLRQALRPFLDKYGPLELARLLAEVNPKIAGKIAGEEHERLLRSAARQFYPGLREGHKGWADALLGLLAQDGHISLEEKTILRKVWAARNQAVHPEGALSSAEVENMIDAIERIDARWDTRRE
ncbi:MAG: hypothetical protein ACRD1N_01100 [Terriglobia bacterium]